MKESLQKENSRKVMLLARFHSINLITEACKCLSVRCAWSFDQLNGPGSF